MVTLITKFLSYMNKPGHHIVFVDSDSEDCYIMTLALEEVGIKEKIVSFSFGEELIVYLKECPDNLPTLIVLHYNIFRKGTEELLKTLKKNAAYQDIPVIIYATGFEPEERQHCLDLGALSCHEKAQTYHDSIRLAGIFAEASLQHSKSEI